MSPERLLNRKPELQALEACWKRTLQGDPQLVVVWGRRRVGKTFLLSHFARRRRSVFFAATQQSEAVELRRLHEALARDLGPGFGDLAGGGFTSWEAALRFLAASASHEPLLAVLDEVPYLAGSTPGFASIIQSVWDHLERPARLMLVISGSAIATMESMLGGRGPLRGRPAMSVRMDPFTLGASSQFLPRLDPAGVFEAYACCGGYPLHLRAWDESATTQANLLRLAGTPGGILIEDASGIWREELNGAGGYPRILAAIGRGRTRMSDIASEAQQRIEHPLQLLIRAGFVRRSVPVGAPGKTRPLYEIDDPYLGFWFSVLYSEMAYIEAGQGAAALARSRPSWQRHLGWVFEEQARAHAARLASAGGLPAGLVTGRWWTSAGDPAGVDVLGLMGSRTHLLSEAKWREAPLGLRDLKALMAKAHLTPNPVEDPLYVLWGRGGVDAGARRAGALGFGLKDLFSP